MPRRVPVPDELLAGPFTTGRARALGVSRRVLDGRRFRRLHRDVHVSAALPDTPELHRAAALLVLPPGAVFSHRSAVEVHRLPLALSELRTSPGALDLRPHVSVPAGGPVPDPRGLVVHTVDLPPAQVTVVGRWPVTSAARTFLDRAADLDLPDLVGLGDALLRRGPGAADDLAAVLAWADRRRGVVLARRAAGLLDPGAASPMESRQRLLLVLAGLPRPESNVDLYDDDGGWLATGDLVYRAERVVIEYDGEVHGDERRRRADLRRRNLLTMAGYTVLHYSADDILRRPHVVVSEVRAALAAAGRRFAAAS